MVYYDQVPDLLDAVVLDPQWLASQILGPILTPSLQNLKNIFDRGVKANADGTIPLKQLLAVLGPSTIPLSVVAARNVVDIMLKLELCLERGENILIPGLLQITQPPQIWQTKGAGWMYLGRRLVVANDAFMLPAGLFSRFQIVVHSLPMLQGVKCRLPLLWHGGIAFSSLRGVECMVLQTVTDRSLDIWVRSPDVTLTVLRETLEEIFSALQDFCATAYPIVVLDELCLSPAYMQKYQISAEAFNIVGYLLQDCLLAHKNGQARIRPTHPNVATHAEQVIDILGIALTFEQLKALEGHATPALPDTLVTLLITPSLEPQQSLGLLPGVIQLVDASLGSEFAKYVLQRFRREDPSLVVSRISHVHVNGQSESSFCNQLLCAAKSRSSNPLLRPENHTDPASVDGLRKLTEAFEVTCLGVNPMANIVMAWHGTPAIHVEAVCRDGPRAFRFTDAGYFGAGSYFALELDYASRYAKMAPPNANGEYCVILFAVCIECAYVVTPARDYVLDKGPQVPPDPSRGFSTFWSKDPKHAQVPYLHPLTFQF